MPQVEVRDRMLWTKHVHGDIDLALQLEALPAGKTVRMRVAGKSGVWEKVNAAAIRPVGEELRAWWRNLFETKRGQLVDLTLEEPANDWRSAGDAEREAAWAAFKALTKAGWSSEGDVVPGARRDDLHER
jgi:hypothetical protein